MYICPNCGKTYETAVNFCEYCGSRPVAQDGALQPVAYPAPRVRQPKNIAGMVLSIVGMVLGLVSAIYVLFGFIFTAGAGSRVAYEMMTMFGSFGLVFAIIGIPLSIVGLSISNGHLGRGSIHKTATLGRTFGIVGTILDAAQLLFSIILIAAA